jgi:hypothetical protein
MKSLLISVILSAFVFSCTKFSEYRPTNSAFGEGVFIVNEGNFRAGNGSLSFFSYDSMKIYNDLFYKINGRPLGDVPNSMITYSGNTYIVVNNSGKIEVADLSTLKSIATIDGLISPRNMTIINGTKAYVSSLYSDSVAIVNLISNSIKGYINLRRSSESIAVAGVYAYISNWFGGNKIMVVNTLNDKVVDSVEVGTEPESMVIDRNSNLWVLCNGGWARQNSAELILIDTHTNDIEKKYLFPNTEASPLSLQIDGTGTVLYYLDKGVRQMDITSGQLPASALIPEAGRNFYKLGINPANNDILVTDAVDFTQPGYVLVYTVNGALVTKQRSDILPGSMCFKLKMNTQII